VRTNRGVNALPHSQQPHPGKPSGSPGNHAGAASGSLPGGQLSPSAARLATNNSITAAVELIPAGSFVLTASYAETRGGVIARWVQRVSSSPHLVVVAIEKGQPLSPVIRDSRRFGLCQLAPEDRVLMRIFDAERPDAPKQPSGVRAELIDPFLGLPTRTTASGVPILAKSLAWIECELTRHLDVEGNCELYIGLVHDGGVLRAVESASGEVQTPAPPLATGPTHATGPSANVHPHAAPKLPATTTPKPRPTRRRAR